MLDADADDGAWWSGEPCATDDAEARETLLVVTQVLTMLSAHERELLLASAYGYRHDEQAQRLDISIPSVKGRLLRARMALREQYARAI